jgi:hypothetical protein
VTLDNTDGSFLQVAGGGDEEFDLELQLSEGELRRCTTRDLSVDTIEEAFLLFARGDRGWIASHGWEPIDLSGPTLAELAEQAGVSAQEYMDRGPSSGRLSSPAEPNVYNSTEGWLFVATNTANDLLYLGFGVRLSKRLERLKEEYGGKFSIIAKAWGSRYDKLSIVSALDRAGVRDRAMHSGGWFPDSPMVRHALESLSTDP